MATNFTMEELLQRLQASEWLSAKRMQRVRRAVEEQAHASPAGLLKQLVGKGWLTDWQSQQLRSAAPLYRVGKCNLLDAFPTTVRGSSFLGQAPESKQLVRLDVFMGGPDGDHPAPRRVAAQVRRVQSLTHPTFARIWELLEHAPHAAVVSEPVGLTDVESSARHESTQHLSDADAEPQTATDAEHQQESRELNSLLGNRQLVARLLQRLAVAWAHAHEQHIYDPKLTPQQLIWNSDGKLKVEHFGLSHLRVADPEWDDLDPLLASDPAIEDGAAAAASDDLTRLGRIGYALLTGSPHFDASASPASRLEIVFRSLIESRPGEGVQTMSEAAKLIRRWQRANGGNEETAEDGADEVLSELDEAARAIAAIASSSAQTTRAAQEDFALGPAHDSAEFEASPARTQRVPLPVVLTLFGVASVALVMTTVVTLFFVLREPADNARSTANASPAASDRLGQSPAASAEPNDTERNDTEPNEAEPDDAEPDGTEPETSPEASESPPQEAAPAAGESQVAEDKVSDDKVSDDKDSEELASHDEASDSTGQEKPEDSSAAEPDPVTVAQPEARDPPVTEPAADAKPTGELPPASAEAGPDNSPDAPTADAASEPAMEGAGDEDAAPTEAAVAPLVALPRAVELPERGTDEEPAASFRSVMTLGETGLDESAEWLVTLVGGDQVGRAGVEFRLQVLNPSPVEFDSEIQLVERSRNDATTSLARLFVEQQQLRFQWLEAALSAPQVDMLTNCGLLLQAGATRHVLQLRRPLELEPMRLQADGSGELQVPLERTPRRELIHVEVVSVAEDFPPYRFDRERRQMSLGRDQVLLLLPLGEEPRVGLLGKLNAALRGELTINYTSLIPAERRPQPYEGRVIDRRLLELQAARQRIEQELAQMARLPQEQRGRLLAVEQNLQANLRATAAERERLAQLKNTVALLEQRPIEFRVFLRYEESGVEIDLATPSGDVLRDDSAAQDSNP